ncbi:MAG: hypothetical protein IK094_07145 [Treponema sp.]|nr:hypothetical protein [Treponema sp.]
MRKYILIIATVLLSFCLASCVDYVQSVSYKNGKYQMYCKVTLAKMLFAMVNEDPEKIFNGFDDQTLGDLPKSVVVKPVNTELEVGAEFSFNIDQHTANESEKACLPTVQGNKCYVPFIIGQNKSIADSASSNNDESEAFAKAILSSAKCRVLIGKNIMPSIETAYFEGKGNQNYSIPVFDYGEDFCLEIPFIALCEEGMYRTDRIVVIKGAK